MAKNRNARQMNGKASEPAKAASTAPAKHQFIGTNPTKKTQGPKLPTKNVGPAGSPYVSAGPSSNGG